MHFSSDQLGCGEIPPTPVHSILLLNVNALYVEIKLQTQNWQEGGIQGLSHPAPSTGHFSFRGEPCWSTVEQLD